MIQSFLQMNRSSLVVPFNHQTFTPSAYHNSKPCCVLGKVMSGAPTISNVPKSPNYKRKKIFQIQKEHQSELTATFQGVNLEASKVDSYKMPSTEQTIPIEEPKLAVKKVKTTKQNVLCFQSKDKPFKKTFKSMQTIPSTQNEIIPQSNEQIPSYKYQNQKVKRGQPVQSLEVSEAKLDYFTFNSDSNSKLSYSDSNGWMGESVESEFGREFPNIH